jgi:hypothetical protein
LPRRREDTDGEGLLPGDSREEDQSFCSRRQKLVNPPAGLRRAVVEREDMAADGIKEAARWAL